MRRHFYYLILNLRICLARSNERFPATERYRKMTEMRLLIIVNLMLNKYDTCLPCHCIFFLRMGGRFVGPPCGVIQLCIALLELSKTEY